MIGRLIHWLRGTRAGHPSRGAAGPAVAPCTPVPRRRSYPAASLQLSNTAISSAALKTCEGLQRAGFKAYVVGGGVRDLLLGLRPKDFDVATDAPPETVQQQFRRARLIGRRFRIVHVIFGRETIEVSTFRAMQVNAQTDEHGRMLNDNVFGSEEEDALRRDFTVNALYYDPIAEEVIDYLGGVEDLRSRKLRMIGDPATRYREDPVRMLRTVRFAAKLGFDVDPPTLAPIRPLAELLENVPAARLFDEILKLLESGHALECIRRLRAEGLHHGVLPLLDSIFEQDEKFVTLALERTDERVRADKSISPSFLFATLLWLQVRSRWQLRLKAGEHAFPALHTAIDSVLEEQAEKLAIQRRYQADMREIWVMQPRLEKRGRTAFHLLEHLRFRAGYDFLLLRCEAGELPAEVGEWWTRFIESGTAEREELIRSLAPQAGGGNKRRRRRSGGRSNAAGAEAAGGTANHAGRPDQDVPALAAREPAARLADNRTGPGNPDSAA
jgi:poly(A) polymerase